MTRNVLFVNKEIEGEKEGERQPLNLKGNSFHHLHTVEILKIELRDLI